MKKIAIFLLLLLSLTSIQAQNQDSLQVLASLQAVMAQDDVLKAYV